MTGEAGRVLLLSPQPYFQWRGSPIRVSFNVRALVANGWAVDLLAMPVGDDLAIEGARTFRVPNVLGVRDLPIGPSPAKAFLDVFLFFKAWQLARRNSYDVIHGIEEAGFLALLLGGLFRTGVVYEKHSDPASYRKGLFRSLVMSLYGAVERITMRGADAVIGTGPGLVEAGRRDAPETPAFHIFDIPSSLAEAEPGRTQEVRETLRKSTDEIIVTYVGSFAVYQGIDLLFDSMPHALEGSDAVRFVVIGGSDDEISRRRRQLEEKGIARRVSLVGKVPPDELPDYLAASDILLSPRMAGHNTPLKLLDYLKAGRPVVATDNEANRLILDEEVAVLVEPTPRKLADGILRLATDGTLRNTLGTRGRRLIDEEYNFENFRSRLADCYDRVCRKARRGSQDRTG